MYARIATFESDPASVDDAINLVRERGRVRRDPGRTRGREDADAHQPRERQGARRDALRERGGNAPRRRGPQRNEPGCDASAARRSSSTRSRSRPSADESPHAAVDPRRWITIRSPTAWTRSRRCSSSPTRTRTRPAPTAAPPRRSARLRSRSPSWSGPDGRVSCAGSARASRRGCASSSRRARSPSWRSSSASWRRISSASAATSG